MGRKTRKKMSNTLSELLVVLTAAKEKRSKFSNKCKYIFIPNNKGVEISDFQRLSTYSLGRYLSIGPLDRMDKPQLVCFSLEAI